MGFVLVLLLLCVLRCADCGKGSESIVQQALHREVPSKRKGQVEGGTGRSLPYVSRARTGEPWQEVMAGLHICSRLLTPAITSRYPVSSSGRIEQCSGVLEPWTGGLHITIPLPDQLLGVLERASSGRAALWGQPDSQAKAKQQKIKEASHSRAGAQRQGCTDLGAWSTVGPSFIWGSATLHASVCNPSTNSR